MNEPTCPFCGSENVVGYSRVVGYFSPIPNWNKGKLAEFEARQRGDYKLKNIIKLKGNQIMDEEKVEATPEVADGTGEETTEGASSEDTAEEVEKVAEED